MIILSDIPFERQAKFLYDNVCTYPSAPEFRAAVGADSSGLEKGLGIHLDLLKAVYADAAAVEGGDDKARYANLIATLDLLYAVFGHGTLRSNSDAQSVLIDKDALGKAYRKGSLTRRKCLLEHHGFAVRYVTDGEVSSSLSKATHVSVSYTGHPTLVPALKLFAERVASIPEAEEPVLYNQFATFLKADYEAAFLNGPIPRDHLDPLREDILRTVDSYRGEWIDLTTRLVRQCGLTCSGFWHYGASPSWSISFSEGRKKPLAIFTVGSNVVFIEFTLPVGAAEPIILARHTYSDTIRERIESFHCVKCPKDCRGANLTKIDGVRLCKDRAEARRIYATLKESEDFRSVRSMLDLIYL